MLTYARHDRLKVAAPEKLQRPIGQRALAQVRGGWPGEQVTRLHRHALAEEGRRRHPRGRGARRLEVLPRQLVGERRISLRNGF